MFNFSPDLICNYWNCPVVESDRIKELNFNLDMNKVAAELTSLVVIVWPDANSLSSPIQTSKYCIFHKIVIANRLHQLHISSISEDLVVLLYVIGTNEPFDLGRVIFQMS